MSAKTTILEFLEKLPPIKRSTIRLITWLLLVGGMAGGVFAYIENFTQHASTDPSISQNNNLPKGSFCRGGSDYELDNALYNKVVSAQKSIPVTTSFTEASSEVFNKLQNLNSMEIASQQDYSSYKNLYQNSSTSNKIAKEIISNAMRNTLESTGNDLFDFSNNKLKAIKNELSTFNYDVKPNTSAISAKNNISSQDSGAKTISLNLPVKYLGEDMGGYVRLTLQLQKIEYSQVNIMASYDSCSLSNALNGSIEGSIEWLINYTLTDKSGKKLSSENLNIIFTENDDPRLAENVRLEF